MNHARSSYQSNWRTCRSHWQFAGWETERAPTGRCSSRPAAVCGPESTISGPGALAAAGWGLSARSSACSRPIRPAL
ncbi:hypothetical protein BpHYR1_009190 [Brachionus plicatilis]|uniref:Uncharacterized protein n=1 Tax=Brachionus plicatilis TaxID=10195 RepID=A0A3M7P0P3_BRAPC|nr:hypothetical protein BpHYR1_009190 [Brachionus plicatilis]